MKIAYLLPEPVLGGGNKVIFQHAQLLLQRGHQVTTLAKGGKPDWVEFSGNYINYEREMPALVEQDLVIATYWTTISKAEEIAVGPIAHFCQGYEGDLEHLSAVRPQIEAVYQRRLPTLTVSPHLGDLVRQRFGRHSKFVPPSIDPTFKARFRLRPRFRPRIMIQGIFEAEVKGVRTALEAIRILRENGMDCSVIRVSTLPLSAEEESLLTPDEYLYAVRPTVVASQLRNCDLLLFTSLPMEGFGLPMLEAMISKVPVVASRIPSAEYIGAGSIELTPPGDAAAFAAQAERLLSSPRLWRRTRAAGYRAAMRFSPDLVSSQLETAVRWARESVI